MSRGEDKAKRWGLTLTPIEPSSVIRGLGLAITFGCYFFITWEMSAFESFLVGTALVCLGHLACYLNGLTE